ncbi:ribonuclease H-like domain-containing protein [Tanacetum coccineum]
MSWAKRLRRVPMTSSNTPMRMEVFSSITPRCTSAKQLWDICEQYGKVVDSFIPARVSKEGKKYAFVLFIKKQHVRVNVPVSSSFSRFFAAPVSNDVHHHKNEKLMEDKLVIVIDEDCLSDKNSELNLVTKVKTFDSMPNLRIIFKDEGFEYVTISFLMLFGVTAALIDVNAAQSKLVLLENFNENYSKCLRLLLKEFDLLKWDQQVVSELVALRNFARRYGSRFCTHDYALWEVIENGVTLQKTQVVEGVTIVMPITSAEDKAQRRLEVKARTVKKRFGKNAATKKTKRNLLKQQYENFTAPSSEMLDHTRQ